MARILSIPNSGGQDKLTLKQAYVSGIATSGKIRASWCSEDRLSCESPCNLNRVDRICKSGKANLGKLIYIQIPSDARNLVGRVIPFFHEKENTAQQIVQPRVTTHHHSESLSFLNHTLTQEKSATCPC